MLKFLKTRPKVFVALVSGCGNKRCKHNWIIRRRSVKQRPLLFYNTSWLKIQEVRFWNIHEKRWKWCFRIREVCGTKRKRKRTHTNWGIKFEMNCREAEPASRSLRRWTEKIAITVISVMEFMAALFPLPCLHHSQASLFRTGTTSIRLLHTPCTRYFIIIVFVSPSLSLCVCVWMQWKKGFLHVCPSERQTIFGVIKWIWNALSMAATVEASAVTVTTVQRLESHPKTKKDEFILSRVRRSPVRPSDTKKIRIIHRQTHKKGRVIHPTLGYVVVFLLFGLWFSVLSSRSRMRRAHLLIGLSNERWIIKLTFVENSSVTLNLLNANWT